MEDRRFEGLDPCELETHRAWLHKLALAILRDADQAEDCVQDVFLTALRNGPARGPQASSLRAWLKRVLVNRARRSIERAARRRYHEGLLLVEHAALHAREPLELRELQMELHRGVLALEPRYRDVVRLRHEQGLPPLEIAQELQVPIKTVNSWLYRAYGQLRARLDGRFEGFQGWAPLLLATRGADSAATSASAARPDPDAEAAVRLPRTWLRSWKTAGVAAGAVTLTGLVWLASRPSEAAAPSVAWAGVPEAAAAAPAGAEPILPRSQSDDAGARATRVELTSLPALPGTPAQDEPPPWSGRVLDADGGALAGLHLRFEPLRESDVLLFGGLAHSRYEELLAKLDRSFEPQVPDALGRAPAPGGANEAVSAADGRFSLRAPRSPGWIAVDDARWSTLTTAVAFQFPPAAEARVQLAPARRLAGLVRDQDGLPLPAVHVELHLPERFLATEVGVPTRLAHEPSVRCDEQGRFVFERVPDVADVTLRFRADGYEPAERRVGSCRSSGSAPAELEVTLLAEEAELVVAGRALDAFGAPVAGAILSFDWTSTASSDEDGGFRLRLPEARSASGALQSGTLRAAAPGFQPLVRALRSTGEAWPRVELVFEAEALELSGVVLRADGTPHANAAVWTPAPAPLVVPPGNQAPIFMEHVMGGVQDGGSLQATVTDTEGRFRLRGLQERPYVLRVADLETREWFEGAPIHAGEDELLLEFPPDGCFAEVRGIVVDRDGAPLAQALLSRSYPRLDAPLPDGRRFQLRFSGDSVAVDADGRFRLTNVARRGGLLTVFGAGLAPRHVELEREPDPTTLRLVVGRVSRVVVERGGLECDHFTFLDAQRGRVDFQPARAGAGVPLAQAALLGERSEEVLVSDLARELVLWAGTREVARLPITLDPTVQNVLHP